MYRLKCLTSVVHFERLRFGGTQGSPLATALDPQRKQKGAMPPSSAVYYG